MPNFPHQQPSEHSRIISRLTDGLTPMVDLREEKDDKKKARIVNLSPGQALSKEELDAVHRAVRYTQAFKQGESYAKMDEEEIIQRPIPSFRGIGRT